MNQIRTKQLLFKLAKNHRKQKENYSTKEIKKQIQEIKYLTAQKKVPRLTLRKNIILLEQKMDEILDIEHSVLRQKKKDSVKMMSLKRQNHNLKKKLNLSEHGDIHKKIEKLSHALGEFLAKKGTKEEILMTRKVLENLKKESKLIENYEERTKKVNANDLIQKRNEKLKKQKVTLNSLDLQKIKTMHHRIEMLKHELLVNKSLEMHNPGKIHLIEQKIKLIDEALNKYSQQMLTCPVKQDIICSDVPTPTLEPNIIGTTSINNGNILKHDLLFGVPAHLNIEEEEKAMEHQINIEMEKELPLPPPPRV